jgi:hypothetical protein
VFQKLGRPQVADIAALMLAETVARVEARGMSLSVAQPLMEHIIASGYSDEYGVRPLRCGRAGDGAAGRSADRGTLHVCGRAAQGLLPGRGWGWRTAPSPAAAALCCSC